MRKILICSSITPSIGGGVPAMEYYSIKGLIEKRHTVNQYFPHYPTMAFTDIICGLPKISFDGIIHAHSNITWNTPGALRTYHGVTKLGRIIAQKDKMTLFDKGIHGKAYFALNSILENRCAHINKCIAVSQYIKDALIKEYKAKEANIRLVYNGIDSDRFSPNIAHRKKFRIENRIDNKFVVTWSGHFEFNKGIGYLCKIIEKLKNEKDIMFVLRLSTRTQEIPAEYSTALSGKNVIILKHGLNMPEFYNSSDCHLVTSTYEPFGLVLIEAMSCKKPVISTMSGGPEEIILDGKNGFLFNKRHIGEITEQIKEIRNSTRLSKFIGKRARETVLNKFTYQKMTDMTLDAYKYFSE